MPGAKKNTVQLVCRVDFNVIDTLKSINPSLVTRDTVTGKIKFRHGALGRYIQRLINEDIDKREERKEKEGENDDDILDRFRT